jgi:hypothetical protein
VNHHLEFAIRLSVTAPPITTVNWLSAAGTDDGDDPAFRGDHRHPEEGF